MNLGPDWSHMKAFPFALFIILPSASCLQSWLSFSGSNLEVLQSLLEVSGGVTARFIESLQSTIGFHSDFPMLSLFSHPPAISPSVKKSTKKKKLIFFMIINNGLML